MRKLLTLAVGFLVAIVGAPSAHAQDAQTKCITSMKGATYVPGVGCNCPYPATSKDGKCIAECKVDTPAPAATPKRQRRAKAPVEPRNPTCTLDKGGTITPPTSDALVDLTLTCEPGTTPITTVTADCLKGCTLGDGAKTENYQPPSSKAPVRVSKKFTVRPIPKAGEPGTTTFTAKAKDGEGSTSVTIKWPAPEKSADQKTCEGDKDTWNPLTQECECRAPRISKGWVDDAGKVHFCKDPEKPAPLPPPVIAKDGKDGAPGVTTVVHEGGGTAFVLRTSGILLKDGPDPLTGIGFSVGGSFGVLNDSLRLEFTGGIMYSPTAEYDVNGHQVRDASGNINKNSTGFLADGTVSYLPYPWMSVGLGVGYWRFGQHWSDPGSGKGTIESMGAIGKIAFYPARGRHASLELGLVPTIGSMWGGRSDARFTAGVTLTVGVRLW